MYERRAQGKLEYMQNASWKIKKKRQLLSPWEDIIQRSTKDWGVEMCTAFTGLRTRSSRGHLIALNFLSPFVGDSRSPPWVRNYL
jgi:hypothetical protein